MSQIVVETRRDPAESRAQIKAFARKVLRRMRSAGDHTVMIEDIEGEMWVAWTKADSSFNPEVGVAFKTYLYKGLQLHINRWVARNLTRRIAEVHARSTDERVDEDESDERFGDKLPSTDILADEALGRSEAYQAAQKLLSPRARIYLRLMADPPQELVEALRPLAHKHEIGRSRGIRVSTNLSLTSTMLLDLMDATRTERTKILSEIRTVGEHLRQIGAI